MGADSGSAPPSTKRRAPTGLVAIRTRVERARTWARATAAAALRITRVTCLGDIGLVRVDRRLHVSEPLLDDAEVVDDRRGVVLGVGLPEEATRSLEVPELQEADAFREVAPGGFGVVCTRVVGDEQGAHADGNYPIHPQSSGDSTVALC